VRRRVANVKAQRLVLGSAILLAIASAQVSKPEALSKLRETHQHVTWNSEPLAVADVLCEGKPATVILGSENKDVVIGVVSGMRSHKTEVLSFPISSGTQNGFCGFPVRITTSPLDCAPDIGALPGCKPVRGCRSFTVIDDECDSFNFYWDSSRRSLAFWRH
jgi:hypothetical protein